MPSRKHTTPTQLDFSFTEAEIWRPVLGYEGYLVSNWGRIKSLSRLVPCGKHVRQTKECILKPAAHRSGHCYVSLCNGTPRPAHVAVHTIVCAAFFGPQPEGYVVNHIDFNPANNRVENLEYLTPQANVSHTVHYERHARGEIQGHAKLTEEQVKDVRILRQQGWSRDAIAERCGVTVHTIKAILVRRNWKHIP